MCGAFKGLRWQPLYRIKEAFWVGGYYEKTIGNSKFIAGVGSVRA